jgi:hypothetical protein
VQPGCQVLDISLPSGSHRPARRPLAARNSHQSHKNPAANSVGNVKSHELANLCADTIGQVSDAAEDGLHRVSSDAPLCFAFLRHTGLRL